VSGTAGPVGTTRLAAVIGDPIRHSLSPVLHNAAFRQAGLDWIFVAFEVAPAGLARAVAGAAALGIEGLSVTMPHKSAVVDLVDDLSPTAAALGAVNTLVRSGAAWVGHNTDGAGFIDSLAAGADFDPAGRTCVVVGAGGAARAVVRALAEAGAAEVIVVNRSPDPGRRAASLAGDRGRLGTMGDVAGADLVVNATPVGMAGMPPGPPVDPQFLKPGQVVADLVYHPAATPLLGAAAARGATAVGGLGMLVHQAAHAFRLWTGQEAPVAAMEQAARAAL